MMQWPEDEQLTRWWPFLGTIDTHTPVGSGVELSTTTGVWHLKRRTSARADAELLVTSQLHAAGVPVTLLSRAPGDPTPGTTWLVYRALPGRPFNDFFSPSGRRAAFLLGRDCAILHRHLAGFDLGRLRELGVADRPATTDLGVQLLHRDYHPGNVLYDGERVTGYLDFDHLEIGTRMIDVVYCLGGMAASAIDSDGVDPATFDAGTWTQRWRDLLDGYDSVSPILPGEADALTDLFVEVENDFVDWFASIGDEPNVELTHRLIDLGRRHPHRWRRS
ncbi:MAG TPA: phosphotransferase [Propionibacteriaceae bacterium]|nr:phosphotransferase [Propionibacteriaceae bacterium]